MLEKNKKTQELITIMKYEIMLVVNGELTESQTYDSIGPLLNLIKNNEHFTEKVTWGDQLAYVINKKNLGHRFLWNFESSDVKAIKEFNRLAILNKEVLRHLVINLEKDYAYKTKTNPKKIKSAEIRQKKFQDYLAAKSLNAEAATNNNEILPEGALKKTRTYNINQNVQIGRRPRTQSTDTNTTFSTNRSNTEEKVVKKEIDSKKEEE